MKSKYFDVIYEKVDESFAEVIADKADKVYEDIIGRFGFDGVLGDEEVVLTICESVPRYIEVTNKTVEEYQEWMVGNSDFENRKITILSPRVSTTHTSEDIEKVLVHEIIHMIFDVHAGNDNAPIWCAEGIAILYAEQVELEYIDERVYPKIDELLDEESFAERGGYDYAGVYVWYFIERYGFAKFLELYCNVADASGLIYEGFESEAIRKFKDSSK